MSLLNDSFTAYVNLDSRYDRNIKMLESLNNAGIINYERVRGIPPIEWPNVSKMNAMLSRRQVGAIGCYLSQISIMNKALSENKHAFVMEDDIIFCSDFQKRVKYIDSWIDKNKNWDIIWAGGTFHIGRPYWDERRNAEERIGRDAECTDDPRIMRTYGSFSTFCYWVNKNSIQKILNLLDTVLPISWGIDHSMIKISHKINSYAFVPGMVKQYDNLSDQVPGSGEWTNFSNFAKLNGTIENSIYWYQDKMENFDPQTFDWKEAKIK